MYRKCSESVHPPNALFYLYTIKMQHTYAKTQFCVRCFAHLTNTLCSFNTFLDNIFV